MDGLVHPNVRKQCQTRTSEVRAVCEETSRPRNHHGAQEEEEEATSQQHQQTRSHASGGSHLLGPADRAGDLARDRLAGHQQGSDDGRTGGQSDSREQEPVRSNDWRGDGDDQDASTSAQSECEIRALIAENSQHASHEWAMLDLDFDFLTSESTNSFQSKIRRDVRRFIRELQSVIQTHSKCRTARLDLLEVMCSEQSELTNQMMKLGGRAKRLGRIQGDLNTVEGRRKLFTILVQEQPRHLWISPECGPWCQWSF